MSMNPDFVWPSDAARAESDELDRVCEELEEAEVERQFRAFIEKGGNTKVDFMTVTRDSDEAQDVA